jgi:uncharacterized protein YdeI (YjbR/CyaY-like superfamily)
VTELPELLVADVAGWRQWLGEHFQTSPGVWLVLHKKGGSVTTLTYDDALDEALCVGWIDGQVQRRDEQSFRQRFTPRRPRSPWSTRNVGHVERLRAEGRMQPAGEAAIRAAHADGRLERAYTGPATMQMQDDVLAAVAANPSAQAMFDVLTKANLFAIYYRVNEAKRPDTRARRIAAFVEMLADGRTPHPQKQRPAD